ncbi:hypothetical protein CSC28_0152 [Pseudomonas paraeruginosa]|nr:hypothetical protein CSC28_0152 [Pseudomonas paraeruginosa]
MQDAPAVGRAAHRACAVTGTQGKRGDEVASRYRIVHLLCRRKGLSPLLVRKIGGNIPPLARDAPPEVSAKNASGVFIGSPALSLCAVRMLWISLCAEFLRRAGRAVAGSVLPASGR